MPVQAQTDSTGIVPSITTWTRLEPITRDSSMQRSLQAQVRDPLWFLARQYQMGEFLGEDAGAPLHASIHALLRFSKRAVLFSEVLTPTYNARSLAGRHAKYSLRGDPVGV